MGNSGNEGVMRFARSNAAAQQLFAPQARNMATLKELRARISSVQGIQKITSSMKMVAARLGKQERTTFAARPFAQSLQAHFLDPNNEIPLEGKKQLVLLITSDKGLC